MRYTREQLRDQIRSAADMVNTDFITDSEINYFINSELAELHDLLIGSFEDYELNKAQITVDASTEEYDLPLNFYKALKVYGLQGSYRFPMDRFALTDLDQISAQGLPINITSKYRIMGSKIHFIPAFSGSVELWYVPVFHRLSTDTESTDINVLPGWEEFVVAGAAAKCLLKEESDPAGHLMRKEQIKQRIQNMRNNRDASGNKRVVDVYGRDI